MIKPLAVVLTDTHLEEKNIQSNRKIFAEAMLLAERIGLPRIIFHAGDVFQSRKAQTQRLLNEFEAILNEIESNDFMLICVPGNHDKTDYASSKSFLSAFSTHPALLLCEEAKTIKVSEDPLIYITMMPFFEDDVYVKKMNAVKLPKKGIHYCVTHIGLDGAIMNNGSAVESTVEENLFDKFDKVFIGHYHDASVYSDKISYIGSSIQHNFGETPDKGITVIYEDGSTETVEVEGIPKYITFEVDVKDITIKDINDLKEEKETSGNFIRTVLKGREEALKSFDIKRLKDAGITVKLEEKKIDIKELETRVEAFNAVSLKSAFEEFCKKNNLDLNTGMKYLKAVL